MVDYNDLSEFEQNNVDETILHEIEPKHHINKRTGYEYDEPESTLESIHDGESCAKCFMIWYNCLCSHDN